VVSAKCQPETADILNRNADLIGQSAVARDFQAGPDTAKPANAAVAIADTVEVYIHQAIDPRRNERSSKNRSNRWKRPKRR